MPHLGNLARNRFAYNATDAPLNYGTASFVRQKQLKNNRSDAGASEIGRSGHIGNLLGFKVRTSTFRQLIVLMFSFSVVFLQVQKELR